MSSSVPRRLAAAGLTACCLASIAMPAAADGGSTPLTNVIALVAQRLALATPVAQFKWQTGKPITDTPREQQLLADMSAKAQQQGVDPVFARSFFGDQIEASKMVQRSLLDQWRKEGATKQQAPDLATLRPKLDRIDSLLIPALSQIQPVRAQANCPSQLAESLANWKQLSSFDSSQSDALMQALQHICESGGVAVQG